MVKVKQMPRTVRPLDRLDVPIRLYLGVVIATLVALGVLSATAPRQATSEAWGHAVIVSLFAVVLPLRARSARSGSRGAVRAVGIIASVLFVVNVVEALIPDYFPTWMRVQMWCVAAIMAVIVGFVVRWAVATAEH